MGTWYKVTSWLTEIKAVEVVRTTEKMIYVKEVRFGKAETRRTFKKSRNSEFFPTLEEAYSAKRATMLSDHSGLITRAAQIMAKIGDLDRWYARKTKDKDDSE